MLFLIFSISDVNAIKIGNCDVVHDLAEGYRGYSGWFKEKRGDKYHWGLDIPCQEGTPIHSAVSGTIEGWGEDHPKMGNYVVIEHFIDGERYLTYYLHLSEINESILNYDKWISPNETIGKSGNTGECYGEYGGYHLHFEAKKWDDSKDTWNRYCPYESIYELEHTEKYIKQKDEDTEEDEKEDGEDDEPPGKDNPDDNESSATGNPSSLSSDSKNRFYRLAPKKGKKYILQLWNLEKLLEERDQYFESLASGGIPDETYLSDLNTKINEIHDLLSTSSLQLNKERSETPDVVILKNGYFVSASSLIDKSSEAWKRIIPSFSPLWVKENPVMVIPTGGLYGLENSEQFKSILRDYVSQGATIIAFTQQHGYEFSVLPAPDEVPIRAYGWREDQSCRFESMYVDTWHPALSSITKSLVSSPIDGFFADYPSNSTVILSRKVNAMPAMLAYPYGEGQVVVTSVYDDWACTHWQSTTQGRAIVRDLITWAKNPDLEIPEYNLRDNPDPEVAFDLEVKNTSGETASKVKILWLDPDRNLYFEEEKTISIPSGGEIIIPVSHTFSGISNQKLGIWHTDYALYDSEGNQIQRKRHKMMR